MMHGGRVAEEPGILKELPVKINRLVLASTSPYRANLLASTGIKFDIVASAAEEEDIQATNPLELARLRSEHKATGLKEIAKHTVLAITADQVLGFNGQAYGKAESRAEAKLRLQSFAGQSHELYSAYSLVLVEPGLPVKILKTQIVTARLQMRDLSSQEIDSYLNTGEWQGCAGCYQYENLGVHLFDRVDGESSTIIGLPLLPLLADLRGFGVNGLLTNEGPWDLSPS